MSADLPRESYFNSFSCAEAPATGTCRVMNMEWKTVGFPSIIGGTIDDRRRRHLVLFYFLCSSTGAETALPRSDTAAADWTHRAGTALSRDITRAPPGDDELPGISRIPVYRCKRFSGSAARDSSYG